MKYSVVGVYLADVLAATAACSDNPNPSQPSSSNSGLTASVAAPLPVSPGNNAQIKNTEQPTNLVVQNAVSTQTGAVYTFEVATDPAFAAKVQTKDGVAEGSGGQTTVRLDALTPNRDYYWHARATVNGTTGLFGTVYKFTIGPAVTIDPPVPVGPLSGTTTQGWPAFTVNNSTRTSGAGAIAYRFEISTNSTFSAIVVSATVPEQASRTSYTPPSNVAPATNTPLWWRATAVDQTNNVSSPSSAVQNITFGRTTRQADLAAAQGLALWPGIQPPGTNGHAFMGPGWDLATIASFNGVVHTKPTLEQLQIFDLLDRGMDPDSAINWMKGNGCSTIAVYYGSVLSIGFPYEYMALIGGSWE